ncbi:5,6-dimethylbenzimidazole synthase [subsurface metagenome]
MDVMEAIFTRRSIRKYTKQPVSDEVLKELLETAMCAPSAGNRQPWHFIVINDRKVIDEIPKYHQYAQMLEEAAVAIVVCCDVTLERSGLGFEDCSAATQNILLAAHAKGLGAVWLGISLAGPVAAATKKLLNLPENINPVSIISIGYPAEEKPRQDRYQAARVHYNQW